MLTVQPPHVVLIVQPPQVMLTVQPPHAMLTVHSLHAACQKCTAPCAVLDLYNRSSSISFLFFLQQQQTQGILACMKMEMPRT